MVYRFPYVAARRSAWWASPGAASQTLARMAVRLLPPTGGEILFDGESVLSGVSGRNDTWYSRRLQMIFQDPFSSLNPRLRIGTSIAEPLMAIGAPSAERQERVGEILRRVGLQPGHAGRYPHEFSGGQRQRVAIARALVTRPELVVCDEAVSALDASVQAQVLNLLKEVQADFGLTYFFISHDLSVVGYMSDRVAVMYLGRIVEQADRNTLFGSAAHPYTKALWPPRPCTILQRGISGLSCPVNCRAPFRRPPGVRSIPGARRQCPVAVRKPRNSGKSRRIIWPVVICMDSALLQRQEKSPCSRRNRGFWGDGLLDDAGSEAGDIVGTGTAGAGNADLEVSEDKPVWCFRNGGIGPENIPACHGHRIQGIPSEVAMV